MPTGYRIPAFPQIPARLRSCLSTLSWRHRATKEPFIQELLPVNCPARRYPEKTSHHGIPPDRSPYTLPSPRRPRPHTPSFILILLLLLLLHSPTICLLIPVSHPFIALPTLRGSYRPDHRLAHSIQLDRPPRPRLPAADDNRHHEARSRGPAFVLEP